MLDTGLSQIKADILEHIENRKALTSDDIKFLEQKKEELNEISEQAVDLYSDFADENNGLLNGESEILSDYDEALSSLDYILGRIERKEITSLDELTEEIECYI
ncbi:MULTISPECIES: hypothetical protein [unclassified Mannheimia]|uniref:hypothetical protein n=1 Tax=unclassified Mannheimia TaxID=2645054 RepID=UPI00359E393C